MCCPSCRTQVDLLVLEYLAHAGFERATQQLKAELREKREGKTKTWRPVGAEMQERVKERMLRALDHGEKEEVFRLWDNFVPPLLRRADKNAQKLEFYLHIFFAIYPLHPTNSRPNAAGLAASMKTFKAYLETDGAALAVTPEFLAYYAMPYVPEISRHPSFKELFTADWAKALKARLADFLARTPQVAAEPKLLTMVRAHRELGAGASHGAVHPVAEARKDMQALKQRLIDSELRAVEAKREAAAAVAVEAEREAAMRRGAGEVSEVAAEAITQLGYAPMPADVGHSLQLRLRSAEERLGLRVHSFGGGAGADPSPGGGQQQQWGGQSPPGQQQLGQRVQPAQPPQAAASDALSSTMAMLAALDYDAIKQAMLSGSDDLPVVMQALRWRLTKPARRQRKTALVQYIQNDLLDADVMVALLENRADVDARDAAVQEQALRLINLFASEPAGRTYLLGQPDLIGTLCSILTSSISDTLSRQNCLGALQKLSLRRQPQNAMIDADVIAWLVRQLADVDSLSQYSVEYGTALLMNLSLRTAGKSKCTDPEMDILVVLSQLTEHESLQVRTYVNGTLYSILVKGSLKARAEEIGLPDSLKLLIEHSDETFARQINYILEQISKEEEEEEEAQSDDEGGEGEEEEEEAEDEGTEADDEEVDVFAEANLNLEVSGGMSGEELLCSRYVQTDVAEAQHEANQLEASMRVEDDRRAAAAASGKPSDMAARRRHHPDEPLQRPATPRATKGEEGEAEPEDYGATAMQLSGAQPEPATGGDEEAADEGQGPADAAAYNYPDPDAVDASSPTIPVRNRLTRTPSRKTREAPAPLQPTAPRPRAVVEPLKRGAMNTVHSPQPPGSKAKPAGKPPTSEDEAD
jgi:hypothetical protein